MRRRATRYLLAAFSLIAIYFIGSVGVKIYREFRDRNYFPEKSLEDVRALARDQHKLVVAFFTADWCGPCKVMKRDTWRDPSVRALLDKEALTIAIDHDRSNDVCSTYDILGYPTTILFDSDGKEMSRIGGATSADEFLSIMSYVLADGGKPLRTLEMIDGWQDKPNEWINHMNYLLARGEYKAAVDDALLMLKCAEERAGDEDFDPGYDPARALHYRMTRAANGYPPVIPMLKKYRAEYVRKLRAGGKKGDFFGLAILNRFLKEERLTLSIYDEVGIAKWPKKDREGCCRPIHDLLVEDRRYADVLHGIGEVEEAAEGRMNQFGRYRASCDERSFVWRWRNREKLRAYQLKTVDNCGRTLEVLVGAGELTRASSLAKKLVAFDPSPAAKEILIAHVKRAGRPDLAKKIDNDDLEF